MTTQEAGGTRPLRVAVVAISGLLTLAVTALALALVAGAGAPRPAPLGLPDPGLLTGWALPAARLASDIGAVVTIGFLLLPGVLVLVDNETTAWVRRASQRAGAVSAGATSVAVAMQVLLGASDVTATPVFGGLRAADVRQFAAGTTQGWACLGQFAVAVAVAAVAGRRRGNAWPALLVSFGLVGIPALVGHSVSSRVHSAAVIGLVAHVIAASLWVGGLVALVFVTMRAPAVLPQAANRFSRLALVCAVTVGASGALTGVLHAGLPAVDTSGYGLLLAVKLALYGLLVAGGWWHRRRTLPLISVDWPRTGPFLRLAAVELMTMSLAVGVAVALSRTPVQP